jgi:hypothetical protein
VWTVGRTVRGAGWRKLRGFWRRPAFAEGAGRGGEVPEALRRQAQGGAAAGVAGAVGGGEGFAGAGSEGGGPGPSGEDGEGRASETGGGDQREGGEESFAGGD